MKQFFCLTLVVMGLQRAGAFALIGPNNEAYQVPDIGYNPSDLDSLPIADKNIGEEYRRNTPIIYYTIDANFADYFGSNGIAAIDAAFEVFNGLAGTNISDYHLTDLPLEASRVNYRAQALGLTDIKSITMNLITEQMGLTHPERYVWGLHARDHVGTVPCPVGMQYSVIKRNFDAGASGVDQLFPSSYVNGTLYTYKIVEFCALPSPINPILADAVEFPVDPLANTFTAVAAGGASPFLFGGLVYSANIGLLEGSFYTGLTRDDVAGMQYLMRSSNRNIEAAGSDTFTYVTNKNTQLLLGTDDLHTFTELALVLDPATLTTVYPDLIILNSTPIFTNIVSTNTIFYFTNTPFDPVGTPPHLVSTTLVETNIEVHFNHTFGNVFITPDVAVASNFQIPIVPGHSYSNGVITTITTNISSTACGPFSPPGLVCTNVSLSSQLTNGFFGDFYILPSNYCQVSIVATQLLRSLTITNFSDTFIAGFTNASGQVVFTNSFFSQTPTHPLLQYIYLVNPVTCPTNTVALRQGIEKVRFERRDYDSLLNRFFYPITNTYVLNSVTNNTIKPEYITRSIFAPDILITASDRSPGPGGPVGSGGVGRSVSFDSGNALPNLAGPGTILPGISFDFDKVGPIFENVYPRLGEDTQLQLLIWGSFDGSTNPPVIYPNTVSIENLENQVLLRINPAGPDLPPGQVGSNYTNAFSGFTAFGGQQPYHWTLAAGAALPPGLHLNEATGVISGAPTSANVYDFILRMTDSGTRFVERPYTITVNP